VTVVVLALGWALVLSAPLVRRARRRGPRERAASLRRSVRQPGVAITRDVFVRARLPAPVVQVIEMVRARRRARRVDDVVARELPVTVDLLAVAARLAGVRRACALGRAFDSALDDLATEIPRLRPLADALLASDRFGAPVGDALSRLAAEQRTTLRRRAEARARTVPVRLLFPLVFLVLPAFALLTVVPAVFAGLGAT
jgi:hypothetical protein